MTPPTTKMTSGGRKKPRYSHPFSVGKSNFGSLAPSNHKPEIVATCVATNAAMSPLIPAVFPTRYLTPEPEEPSPSILAPRRGTGMWLFNASPKPGTVSTKPGLESASSLAALTFVSGMVDVERYGLFVGGEFVHAHS